MTQARAHTVAEGQHGLYHCVTRCVRRAWLCGTDPLTRVDHEQRKQMVEARIRELGSIFAVGTYAYAVMSNHLHVVVSVKPAAAGDWKADEVAERWQRLYPVRDERYEAPTRTRRGALDWTGQVKGIGSAYWRIVGSVEAIRRRRKPSNRSG